MVLCFYGICVLATTVRALRDLYLICLLEAGPEARIGLRLLRQQKIDTLAMLRPAVTCSRSRERLRSCQRPVCWSSILVSTLASLLSFLKLARRPQCTTIRADSANSAHRQLISERAKRVFSAVQICGVALRNPVATGAGALSAARAPET